MSLNLFLVLPTHGEMDTILVEEVPAWLTTATCSRLQAADRIGFTGVLIPTGRSCEDARLVAAPMIPVTQRLKFPAGVTPGRGLPTVAARVSGNAGQTLQRPRPA